MADRVLKVSLYTLLFGILLIPFYVADGLFFPFITGKNFAFRIAVEVIVAIWLILLARKAVSGPKVSWLFVAISSFMIIVGVSTVFGENPYRSFWSNYERMDGYINLLHLYAYFVVLSSVLKGKLWDWYLHGSLAVALVMGVIGVMQLLGRYAISQSNTRVDGTFGNATYLAVYMMLNIFIALYYMLRPNILTLYRVMYGVLIALFFLVLYHTATRGAMLGLIGGVILMLVLSLFTLQGAKRKLAAAPLVLLVLFGGIFYVVKESEFVLTSPGLSRFANISFKDNTTRTRFIVWGMAMRGAAENPVLGWGPENFNIVFNKYYDPRLHSQETWFDRAHNEYLDWLVMSGILGLAAYLGIFAALIYTIWKRAASVPPIQKNVLMGLFAGYAFQNLFVFDNLTSYILFFMLLALAQSFDENSPAFAPLAKVSLLGSKIKEYLSKFQPVTVSLVPVVILFVIYFANIKPIMANQLVLKNMYPREIKEERLANIKKLFALESFGSMEAREQLLFMLTDLREAPNLDQNLMVQYLELAVRQMSEQLKVTANDARHQLFMGTFLHTFGKVDEGIVYLRNALTLSPKKQLIMLSLARAYLDKGDVQVALQYTKEAYELDPTFGRAIIEYAAMAIQAEQLDTAAQLIGQRPEAATDPRIIRSYMMAGHVDKVIEIWQEQVKAKPNQPQGYFSLAASFYAARRDSEAVATLRKLIEFMPETKDQAEYYIKGIQSGTLPRE